MGYWKQNYQFSLKKMGTTKNLCLHNVRLGYGIGAKYANAKLAMGENRDKKALHPLSTMPTNVAVPVYTASGIWGHIEVCDHGTYYSDGKKVGKPGSDYMWGEWVNGYRIVSWVNGTTPKKKTNEQIAKEVIAGKWGNGATRKKKLEAAGYNYAAVQKIVDQMLKPKPKPAAIKVGDTVAVTGAGTATSKGTGAKTKSFAGKKMKVIQIANGRYGCNQYNQKGAITGWWTASQIKKG